VTEKSTGEARTTLIFACSGASTLGQLSNMAAMALHEEGCGRFYCLAALGAEVSEKMALSQEADARIVIDGCNAACGKAILERAGLPVDHHTVVKQLGIEKQSTFAVSDDEVGQVVAAVKQDLAQATARIN
jgi:uncharacterized metal-binding protein